MTPSDYILQYHKRGEQIDRLNEENKWLIELNDKLNLRADNDYWRGVKFGVFAGFALGTASVLILVWAMLH